jgi:hypothetical protein
MTSKGSKFHGKPPATKTKEAIKEVSISDFLLPVSSSSSSSPPKQEKPEQVPINKSKIPDDGIEPPGWKPPRSNVTQPGVPKQAEKLFGGSARSTIPKREGSSSAFMFHPMNGRYQFDLLAPTEQTENSSNESHMQETCRFTPQVLRAMQTRAAEVEQQRQGEGLSTLDIENIVSEEFGFN